MFWDRRNRHASDDDLSALLDGELRGARLDAVTRHADGCEACAAALRQMTEVQSLLQRLPAEPAPRSFVLTPAMAGEKRLDGAASPSQRRSPFVFAPAVALTLLVALFAVDLSSSGTSSDESFATGGASQAQIAKSESDAGAALDSAEAPERSSVMTAPDGTPVPATAPALSSEGAAVPAPSTGDGEPTDDGGLGYAPMISPVVPQGATAGEVARDEAGNAGVPDAFGADTDDGGTDWLLIAQVLAGIAFIVSAAYVFAPVLFKRGS